jgi:DNA-binding MarR family transcriptional regulator
MHDPPDDIHNPAIRLVSLSQEDLDDASRLLRLLTSQLDPDGLGLWDGAARDDPNRLFARARQVLAHRRKRLEIFGRELFGEPAWDMLLLLYIAEATQRYTIGQLAQASGAPRSTGTRWIDDLEQRGLVEKDQHPTDGRTAFVKLSKKGKDALELYLSGTLAAG